MNSAVRAIIEAVAAEFMVPPDLITQPCRTRRVVAARIEAARRLSNTGRYSAYQIAGFLNHDHTTILFYLDRLSRKTPVVTTKLRWRRPTIKYLHHRCERGYALHDLQPPKKRTKPPRRQKQLYLTPYAGADFREHRFKERPRHG